jgi:hypothetical protein
LNSIECNEFRDLLLYVGQGVALAESDIPGGDKMLGIVVESYKCEVDILAEELKVTYATFCFLFYV